jgi:Pheromone A receptor
MYHIWTRGQEIKSILSSSIGGLRYDHYLRLFMLCGIDLFVTISLNLWYFRTWFPILPWQGWMAIHSAWSQIRIVTTAELEATPSAFYQLEIMRWVCVVYGFLFFCFFGITAEARKRYTSAWTCISKICCWRTELSGESFRYVLGFVLFQSISCKPIDLWPGFGDQSVPDPTEYT